MHVEDLRTIVVVSETLHFGRAAAKLNLSQAAVSRTVARVEDSVGFTIFERNTRSVVLTSAGRAAVDVFREFNADIELLRSQGAGADGLRRLHTAPDLALTGRDAGARATVSRAAEHQVGAPFSYPGLRPRGGGDAGPDKPIPRPRLG